jgi:hypothetical protein
MSDLLLSWRTVLLAVLVADRLLDRVELRNLIERFAPHWRPMHDRPWQCRRTFSTAQRGVAAVTKMSALVGATISEIAFETG